MTSLYSGDAEGVRRGSVGGMSTLAIETELARFHMRRGTFWAHREPISTPKKDLYTPILDEKSRIFPINPSENDVKTKAVLALWPLGSRVAARSSWRT